MVLLTEEKKQHIRELRKKAMKLPLHPGVYIMHDKDGTIIYIGKAKALASSEDFENVKAEALSLLKYIQDMELHEIVAAIKKINDYKLDVNDYLDIMAIWYRDVLLFKATNDVNHLVFREEIQSLRRVAQRSSYEGIESVINALEKAKTRLNANVNFDLTMELLMMEIQENG